jgi:hypothetical protein
VPVAGRKPKPDGQAITRHKPTHDWTEVVDVPFSGAPKLPTKMPNGMTWPAWTRRWWAVVSVMPHCTLWSDSDWEFAFDTAALKGVFHISPTNALATEIRNREKVLGTTADYRRDLRIRYVDVKADNPTPAGVVALDDYRDL